MNQTYKETCIKVYGVLQKYNIRNKPNVVFLGEKEYQSFVEQASIYQLEYSEEWTMFGMKIERVDKHSYLAVGHELQALE